MNSRNMSGCIYCGSPGPYSDEHVVCAGLGGDDSTWLLKGLVCGVCNTDIFSKLETKFLRASPVALARLFLQPQTRGRGNKTGMPSTQPKVSLVLDESTQVLLEAELGAGGSSEVLPQILVIDAEHAAVTGPNATIVADFLTAVAQVLAPGVTIIEKVTVGFETAYRVTELIWAADTYVAGELKQAARPPKNGIWIEPLIRPATALDTHQLPPRLFRRLAGQFVWRGHGVEQAAAMLSFLRGAPEFLEPDKTARARPAASDAGFHQRYNFDMDAYDRVFTKIGLNLAAYVLGSDLIRSPAFDASVAYARNGVGNVYKMKPDSAPHSAALLAPSLKNRHAFALVSGVASNGLYPVIFMARLYGGPVETFRLAELDKPVKELEHAVLVHVDYVEQKIRRVTLEGHTLCVAEEMGDAWVKETVASFIKDKP